MIPKNEPDPYAILGVAPTASEAEIRAAYRALVAKYHPDRHQGNPLEELASAKMAEINRAYEILSDPVRRELSLLALGPLLASAGVPVLVAEPPQEARWEDPFCLEDVIADSGISAALAQLVTGRP